jgi:SpoVK/Ycf46/Vps4 family AAA+-type ATPase
VLSEAIWRRRNRAVFRVFAQQFRLEPAQITDLAATVDAETTFDDLWTACRDLSRPRIDDLARKIDPIATWDNLVLAPHVISTLRDIVSQLEHRHLVHEQWGLARGDQRGQAITALFHGPSGTGKTHAAEVIARAAKLDLFHIDLSQVVDKYVGETEKRLRRIFDAAEQGGAVLLFDEADALFGKRGSIERGTDRWANLEVSYLLQRMERYHGLAILTTNAKSSLDHAFLRRLRFVVPFAFPDVTLRVELWRRVFPAGAPLVDIDPARFARLQLTGASIKNVATKAAFHAAHDRSAITMDHLTAAARSEFAKLEMPFPELEMLSAGRV